MQKPASILIYVETLLLYIVSFFIWKQTLQIDEMFISLLCCITWPCKLSLTVAFGRWLIQSIFAWEPKAVSSA